MDDTNWWQVNMVAHANHSARRKMYFGPLCSIRVRSFQTVPGHLQSIVSFSRSSTGTVCTESVQYINSNFQMRSMHKVKGPVNVLRTKEPMLIYLCTLMHATKFTRNVFYDTTKSMI